MKRRKRHELEGSGVTKRVHRDVTPVRCVSNGLGFYVGSFKVLVASST